ncbi:hypothetical protein GGR51DRAFT_479547 [Nemania sp. FL0031]|nr:hypothetical protein GGR51DRAFT_479547 [Nemania sp. FL0031]
MSFGYSVTDLVAGARLTFELVQTLSKSRGACIEYQEALSELRAMEQAFIQAGYLAQSKIFTQDVINAIACISLSSIDTIEKFHERTKALRSRLGSRSSSLDNSWAKVGWQFYGKEELRTLKTQLSERLSSINTLITTASNCIEVSSTVAKYQDKPIEDAPNRYAMRDSTLSPYPPDPPRCDSPHLSSTTIAPSRVSEQMFDHRPDSMQIVEVGTARINEFPTPDRSLDHSEQNSLPFHHHIPAFQKVPPIRPDGNSENAIPKEREFDKDIPRIEKSQVELEREIRAKIEIENAEAAAAAEAAVAEAQFKNKIDLIMQMMTSLHEREAKKEAEAKAKDENARKVIRFKDAVGRKFNFPFNECKTWVGMEDLIKQAFLHVDVLGPHVHSGHYDLIGPNAEIILPQVWEKMIQPDWQVSMHMWPMDRMVPGPPPRPPPGPRPPGPRPLGPPPLPLRPPQPPQPPPQQNQQRPPGSGFQHAQQGLRKASKYELLDRFDPNWREAYKEIISSRGITDEFIRTHQPEIIAFLQNERNAASQIRECDSLASDEWPIKPSSCSGDSDARERRLRLRVRELLKSGTEFRPRRRTIFKNQHLEEGWQTDEEEEKP